MTRIEVGSVRAESPHTAAIYEAGKKILVDSLDVGRDFCKTMITVSTGAIPTYLALIAFATGKDFRPSASQGLLLAISPALALLACVLFAVGYSPVQSVGSLDLPAEIESTRQKIIGRRRVWSIAGMAAFVLAVVVGLWGMSYALGIEVPAPASARP